MNFSGLIGNDILEISLVFKALQKSEVKNENRVKTIILKIVLLLFVKHLELCKENMMANKVNMTQLVM